LISDVTHSITDFIGFKYRKLLFHIRKDLILELKSQFLSCIEPFLEGFRPGLKKDRHMVVDM
jgi:hypothetical protein